MLSVVRGTDHPNIPHRLGGVGCSELRPCWHVRAEQRMTLRLATHGVETTATCSPRQEQSGMHAAPFEEQNSMTKVPVAERMARLGTETAFEVLVKARKLEAQGKSVVHLEIGEPDFDTPQHIKDA